VIRKTVGKVFTGGRDLKEMEEVIKNLNS